MLWTNEIAKILNLRIVCQTLLLLNSSHIPTVCKVLTFFFFCDWLFYVQEEMHMVRAPTLQSKPVTQRTMAMQRQTRLDSNGCTCVRYSRENIRREVKGCVCFLINQEIKMKSTTRWLIMYRTPIYLLFFMTRKPTQNISLRFVD